ncbi:MAG: (2Fe-2S)-binding protein [Methylococcaceae bacterium]|nr:(2Fe-2S)-binding protein [Methylococcaceae bacterium]
MYICICKKVTDHQIRKAVFEQDIGNLRQLRNCLGACDQCGKCALAAKDLISDAVAEKRLLESSGILA